MMMNMMKMLVKGEKKIRNNLEKYDRSMYSGKLQSRLLEQYEEVVPQQASHLDQEQFEHHGNHNQQFSSLLHNPDAGDAGRQ